MCCLCKGISCCCYCCCCALFQSAPCQSIQSLWALDSGQSHLDPCAHFPRTRTIAQATVIPSDPIGSAGTTGNAPRRPALTARSETSAGIIGGSRRFLCATRALAASPRGNSSTIPHKVAELYHRRGLQAKQNKPDEQTLLGHWLRKARGGVVSVTRITTLR